MNRAQGLQTQHLALTLAAAMSLGACLFWPYERDIDTSSEPSGPPSLERRARAMLEQGVWVAFTEDRNQWMLRRCTETGKKHRCELTVVHQGTVVRSVPAYQRSQRYTRAEHDTRAEQLAELLEDLDMDEDYLTVRSRDVTSTRLSAAYGAPSYYVRLADGLLEIAYEETREQSWVMPLGAVRFAGEVRIAGAYSSFQERRLVAFQIRHKTSAGSTTSWVIFRRADTEMKGRLFVVPSLEGLVGKIEKVSRRPRPRIRPKPPPPPTAEPVVPAPPTSSAAPVAIATATPTASGQKPLGPADRPCTTEKDCPAGQLCRSPEEASWNACGAPRPPRCPDGWTGDSCGHCFQQCRKHGDCPEGKRCNGEGSEGFCISPRRCSAVRKIP